MIFYTMSNMREKQLKYVMCMNYLLVELLPKYKLKYLLPLKTITYSVGPKLLVLKIHFDYDNTYTAQVCV